MHDSPSDMRKPVQIKNKLEEESLLLSLEASQIKKIEFFLNTLHTWNKRFNLTAIGSIEDILEKHFLDPLAIFKPKNFEALASKMRGKVLDMGSGAGTPGIILAMVMPYLEIISVEKVNKKIGFQEHVKSQTQLSNFFPISERLETLATQENHINQYDFIIARAFSSMETIFHFASFFLQAKGELILWKGEQWQKEYQNIPNELQQKFTFPQAFPYQFNKKIAGGILLHCRQK